MNLFRKLIIWIDPARHLLLSTSISALAGGLAFRTADMARETAITFFAFYLILILMTLLYIYREKLSNPNTRKLLQFSYVIMGFVLMLTSVMGMLNGNRTMMAIFLLMLFLPGLALMRCGLHFNRNGELNEDSKT